MLQGLLHTHSLLRYFILIALLAVIIKAIIGLASDKPFGKWDNKISLYLLIFTHLQFVVGLVLYFMNLAQDRLVQFGSGTMSNSGIRYWTVEHIFGMFIAVGVITAARSSSKKLTNDAAKHKRLLILNVIALIIIIVTISLSPDRGVLEMSATQ
ncbi:MAG TPA: cytochrome B [Ohtaekwangia sp.]|nr:cytochrome B [Ohtaekwangia sp.]